MEANMIVNTGRPRIAFIVGPAGQKGGGMGRVKDYILQSGGDCFGRVQFEALDTRGSGRAIGSLPLLAVAVLRIWGAAMMGRAALVHVNFGDRGSALRKGIVVVLVRLAAVPVVLHLHAAELVQHYENAGPVLRWLIRLPFHAATCCVVLGALWRDWLTGELGVDPAKVEIVYNGVPVAAAFRPPAAFAAEGTRKILFLGNLIERKGVSDLLHALALLPAAAPKWQATVAGGGNLAHYGALANSLGIAARVSFVGWVDQEAGRALLAESDMLVLPSYNEGLPLVILEALGSGAPVIATSVGAIPEVLEDGHTILFVTPGDQRQLADKLLLVLSDANLRRRLSEEGVRLFQRRFTLDAFLASLFDVYRRQCGVDIEPTATGATGRAAT
jgi:glycosyltransferase involved in cell wall biosynthesis